MSRLGVLGGVALALVLVLLVTCWWYFAPREVNLTQQKTEVITYSTDTPGEEKPSVDYNWRGSADDPKKIIIKSIGVNAFLQNVGVDQNRQIAVPNNIHIAGWFVDSVRPGQKGLAIIDGHVDGRIVSEGVFGHLDTIKEGDEFTIEMGSGKELMYRVSKITTVSTEESASVLYSQAPGIDSQLNLITCTGTYLKDKKTYDKRMIVTSELVE